MFSLSTIALLTKIFGFTEKFVIAHFFGTSGTADVYFATTGVILSVIWIVRELMYPSLLPVFVDSLSRSTTTSGNLFRKAFISTTVFLLITVVVLFFFPADIARIFMPGFSKSKQVMTANLLRTLVPAMFFIGLSMVTYTILNARKNFLKAACPEAILKLFIVLGLIALVPILGIYALGIAMGLGGLGCLLAQLYFIPERSFLFKSNKKSDQADPFKKVILLMSPLVLGVIFSHISGLIDNLLASKLPNGHLSYLGYSKKLIDAILLIGPVALVTVVYSNLSYLASAKEYEKFTDLFIKAFRVIMYLSIPVACLLIGLKQPLIRFLFQRGQFNIESTLGTSQAFMVYAIGLTIFSLETLFVYTFFALSDTKTPVIYGIACVCIDIALAIILLRPLGYLGIAGAFVISKTIKIIVLGAILSKRFGGLFNLRICIFLFKLGISTCMVWGSLQLLLKIHNHESFLNTLIFDLILPGIGALAAFITCSYLLNIDEFKSAITLLKYRKAAVGALYRETK